MFMYDTFIYSPIFVSIFIVARTLTNSNELYAFVKNNGVSVNLKLFKASHITETAQLCGFVDYEK